MKTRTRFKFDGKEGIIHCWTGNLRGFVEDIEEFIIPILENYIIAEFNDTKIVVHAYENAESIFNRFVRELNK